MVERWSEKADVSAAELLLISRPERTLGSSWRTVLTIGGTVGNDLVFQGVMAVHHYALTVALVVAPLIACGSVASPQAELFEDLYGCEGNPTGNPIGGGEGYGDIAETGDLIVRTKDELLACLQEAEPGQVVFVPGEVEIDLAGTMGIGIPAGVTLASDRGRDGSAGALLHNRTTSGTQFVVRGDNARITGIRLEGPHSGTELIAASSVGISSGYYATEVDNCEIFNWNIRGIGIGQGGSRAHIHHNHIHHCQRSGYGYGVSVSPAEVYIIANIFDFCRHHIAADGSPGCSYQAAWNYFSENCTSSLVDMHGGRDRGDGTDIASDWMLVHHNTFGGPRRAVGIRGTPSQGAEIHNNWFSTAPGETTASTGNTRVYSNVYGPDMILQEVAIEFIDATPVPRPEGFADRLVPRIAPCGPGITR